VAYVGLVAHPASMIHTHQNTHKADTTDRTHECEC
jgi:hypothetical protein